jgi:hypothetical protein
MSRIVRALRATGLGNVAALGSQQVARRNAARASAVLLAQRREREDVLTFLAQRPDDQPPTATRVLWAPSGAESDLAVQQQQRAVVVL